MAIYGLKGKTANRTKTIIYWLFIEKKPNRNVEKKPYMACFWWYFENTLFSKNIRQNTVGIGIALSWDGEVLHFNNSPAWFHSVLRSVYGMVWVKRKLAWLQVMFFRINTCTFWQVGLCIPLINSSCSCDLVFPQPFCYLLCLGLLDAYWDTGLSTLELWLLRRWAQSSHGGEGCSQYQIHGNGIGG